MTRLTGSLACGQTWRPFRPALRPQLEADCRYSGYIERQRADIDALRRDEAITIPGGFRLFTLLAACRLKHCDVMIRLRPQTIGQANRLPGLTPAAVVAVLRASEA